jgi:prolyl oligopeptidase
VTPTKTLPTPNTAAHSSDAPGASAGTMAQADDPFLWLEDVRGEAAMAWVRQHNAVSESRLQAVDGHAERQQTILQVLDSQARIPGVRRVGSQFYNLWQDAEHRRGLWRRATLDEYRKAEPAWETVLDLDALGRAEGENWVWAGAAILGPDLPRCLVMLSRGGADAHVVREFDLVTKSFVADGFVLPEAKSSAEWADADTLYVGSDFGPGSLTDSGYPRVIRRWRRGQPWVDAVTVFEGEATDVAVFVSVDRTPGHERTVFGRHIAFFTSRLWLLQPDAGALEPIDKPLDASLDFWRDRVLLSLRSAARLGDRDWPGGSLLVADAKAYQAGECELTALFTPSATSSLRSYALTHDAVVLNLLDTVSSRLEEWHCRDGRWAGRALASPGLGSLAVAALHDPLIADDPLAEHLWINSCGFLEPDTLLLGRTGTDEREPVKALPAFFDARGMRVEQRMAPSKDGTAIPYFIVWPARPSSTGRNPTLLYGYGGFEVSLTPWYLGATGQTWVAAGGVYVVANIRGGGEFGPAWHQAATGPNKQRSYDDFAAVAEDLIRTGVTQARHLGIQGGSNGGLLVGAVMLQRPELFGAVVCQVPLLDMQRYHRLLAGASWMAEYGNPDLADEWAWIGRYSPYQNLRADQPLPATLFVTSTRDDRVHPGHARKMAARMEALGYTPLYWENIEGGHGGAADNVQRAQKRALEQSFLWQQLAPR